MTTYNGLISRPITFGEAGGWREKKVLDTGNLFQTFTNFSLSIPLRVQVRPVACTFFLARRGIYCENTEYYGKGE